MGRVLPRPPRLDTYSQKPIDRPALPVSTGTSLTQPDGYPIRPDLVKIFKIVVLKNIIDIYFY